MPAHRAEESFDENAQRNASWGEQLPQTVGKVYHELPVPSFLYTFLYTFAVRWVTRIPLGCMAQFGGLSLIVLAPIPAPSESSKRVAISFLCPGRTRKKVPIPDWMPRLKVLIVPRESTFL